MPRNLGTYLSSHLGTHEVEVELGEEHLVLCTECGSIRSPAAGFSGSGAGTLNQSIVPKPQGPSPKAPVNALWAAVGVN